MKSLRLVLVVCATAFSLNGFAQPTPGTITFKVPYKFTHISNQYDTFQIICGVSKSGEAIGSGFSAKLPLDSNGSANGVADVVAKANPGKSLSESTDWACQVGFSKPGGNSMHHLSDVAKPGTGGVGDAKGKF